MFAGFVEESPEWGLLAPVPFALVFLRAAPENIRDWNAFNEKPMTGINENDAAYISHTTRWQTHLEIVNRQYSRRRTAYSQNLGFT